MEFKESPNSWHYGSRYLSDGLFNPISTDNSISTTCHYRPNPIPSFKNLYKKSNNNITKTVYNNFNEIKGGEIEYLPERRGVLDNFRSPNFQNTAFIQSKLYKDPMGSLKPEYTRIQTKNNLVVDQVTWMQDSCEWREEIISRQMRKDNQTRFDPKLNF